MISPLGSNRSGMIGGCGGLGRVIAVLNLQPLGKPARNLRLVKTGSNGGGQVMDAKHLSRSCRFGLAVQSWCVDMAHKIILAKLLVMGSQCDASPLGKPVITHSRMLHLVPFQNTRQENCDLL